MRKILACLIVLAALGWAQANAAVAVDACASADVLGVTPLTNNNLTISAGLTNSVLVVVVVTTGAAALGTVTATWNGTSMTQVAHGGPQSSSEVFLFGLRNPASGNHSIVVTYSATGTQMAISGCSFQGVNVTSDVTAFTNANTATGTTTGASAVTVTSATGDVVVAGHSVASAANITAVSGTSIFIDNTGNTSDSAANYANGAASVNMTATIASSTNWAAAGIDLAAAGGGGSSCIAGSLALMGAGC